MIKITAFDIALSNEAIYQPDQAKPLEQQLALQVEVRTTLERLENEWMVMVEDF